MGDEQEQPRPAADYTITSLETVRVVSDPLRLRIIEQLSGEPRTVKQVAAKLDISLTKMYYHINMLEEHGLIRVVATRTVSNIIEKQYQAVAHNFNLDRSLLTFREGVQDDPVAMFVAEALDVTKSEIARSRQTGLITSDKDAPRHRSLIMLVGSHKMKPEQADEFYRRLQALAQEFGDDEQENDDAQTYNMMLALYPALPE